MQEQQAIFKNDLNKINKESIIVDNYDTDIFTKKIKYESSGKYCRIIFDDCVSAMSKIKSDTIDLMLTDPPYNLGLFMHKRNVGIKRMRDNHFAFSSWDDMPYDDWVKSMDLFFEESSRVIKKKGSLLIFMSLIKLETIICLAKKHKFYYKTTGIWHKTNPMPRNMNLQFVNSTEAWVYFINDGTSGTFNNNGKLVHDYIESSVTPVGEKKFGKHPTQKPLNVIKHFVTHLSNKNDFVLDPFMGSGTTGVACEQLGRKFVGIELNENYIEMAKNRIHEISNKVKQ